MNERIDVLAQLRTTYCPPECLAAVAELIEAATAMAGVQVNRRPAMRNDSATAKKARLRAALARIGGAT